MQTTEEQHQVNNTGKKVGPSKTLDNNLSKVIFPYTFSVHGAWRTFFAFLLPLYRKYLIRAPSHPALSFVLLVLD